MLFLGQEESGFSLFLEDICLWALNYRLKDFYITQEQYQQIYENVDQVASVGIPLLDPHRFVDHPVA